MDNLAEAHTYIRHVAHRLTQIHDLDITDHWTQEDDGHYEGLIVIGDEEQAYSWHSEDGWKHLTGPRTTWGPYTNFRDLLGPDVSVDDIVNEITKEA